MDLAGADNYARAFTRVIPLFIILKLPFDLKMSVSLRILVAASLSMIVAERIKEGSGSFAQMWAWDLVFGFIISLMLALFFHASMQATTLLLIDENEGEANLEQKEVLQAFWCAILLFIFISFKVDHSLINVLGSLQFSKLIQTNAFEFSFWSKVLSDMANLSMKVAAFGFALTLSKKLLEDFFSKLGGDNLRIAFSLFFWMSLILFAPLIFPSFSRGISNSLSIVWGSWFGPGVQ